jgi:hypothetical protein
MVPIACLGCFGEILIARLMGNRERGQLGGWRFAEEGLFQVDHQPTCAWRFVSPSVLEPNNDASSASGQTCFGDKLDCVGSF